MTTQQRCCQNLSWTFERALLMSPVRDANVQDVITLHCRTKTCLLPVTCQ